MQCPNCGYVMGPFEASCPKCARLGTTQQVASGAVAPAYRACERCGALAVLSQAACGRCGHPFAAAYAAPAPQQAAPFAPPAFAAPGASSRRRTWAIVGALLLLAIGAGVATVGGRSGGAGVQGASGPRLVMSGGSGGANLTGASAIASDQIDKRLTEASAQSGGDVEVSLAWNGLSDLDLAVREPSQALVDGFYPRSPDGELDVDANPTALVHQTEDPTPTDVMPMTERDIDSMNRLSSLERMIAGDRAVDSRGRSRARPEYTMTPVEHIYFSNAPRGVYTVYARCYWWRESTSQPVPFTIQIRSRGKVFREVSGVIGPLNYVANRVRPTIVCQFEVR